MAAAAPRPAAACASGLLCGLDGLRRHAWALAAACGPQLAAGWARPPAAAGAGTAASATAAVAAAAGRGRRSGGGSSSGPCGGSRRAFSGAAAAADALSGLPPDVALAAEGPAALYVQGLRSGAYRADPLQQVTVQKLQALYSDLRAAYPPASKPSGLTVVDTVGSTQPKQSWLNGISALLKSQSGLHGAASAPPGARPSVRGLYMYGGVGCGKTMLMDLLVASAPRELQVRRTHFHDFMLDVHSRLRHTKGEADPLRHVADDVARDVKVLALDELFVTDVADAMILHRLFGRLWDRGLALVATSNRAPDALYENGLQRQLFLPFIRRLKEACVIHDMASPVDYRRLAHHARGLYFLTPDRTALLHAAFLECGSDEGAAASSAGPGSGAVGNPGPVTVEVAMGRTLRVPQALGAAAMFDFSELCDRPLAAADYIALASRFSTVAVADVPLFGAANRAAAYRFVTLVDVMYEHRVRMLLSAEGTPFELFERVLTQQEARKAGGTTAGHVARAGGAATGHAPASMQLQGFSSSSAGGGEEGGVMEAVVDDQLGFAKDRAISRLTEMQSLEYLIQHARQHAPHNVLALQEAQARQRARQQ